MAEEEVKAEAPVLSPEHTASPEPGERRPRPVVDEDDLGSDADEVTTESARNGDETKLKAADGGGEAENDKNVEDEEGGEDDQDDDEDEEDDEEDDDDQPKKRRRIRRNQFLDVEAEVDDEDEFDDEDELAAQDDGFIQDNAADVEEGGEGAAEAYRRLERRRERERFSEADAEKLAAELRERYGRSAASKYRKDGGHVPQQLLLPSVDDPSIFGIPTRPGREKEIVRALLRKSLSLQYTAQPLQIFSVFQRDSFPGRVYIEAATQAAAVQACQGIPNVYASSKILKVPLTEYPDMFHVFVSQDTTLTPGTYVRVKRGKYAGDLAIVEGLSDNGLEVRLKLVPRLDYGRDGGTFGEKRKRATATQRPPQRLFDEKEGRQHDSRFSRLGSNAYSYLGDEYINGYLVKDFKIAFVATDGAAPTLEEVTRLTSGDSVANEEEGIDLHALKESLKSTAKALTFTQGEAVEVMQGEQAGMRARVVDATPDGIVTVEGTAAEYRGVRISVPSTSLRKHFSVGDHVRVTGGNYRDDTGMVVSAAADAGTVTLVSDTSQAEITVFARDLRVASDTGGAVSAGGKFQLQDLVQLNAQTVGVVIGIERTNLRVLLQDGQVVSVNPASVVMKLTTSARDTATDAHGRQIGPGDTVRELNGKRRQGVILHLYHQYVFLHNREITANLGVFVDRTSLVVTVATKGARNERGLDLSSMNPAAAGATPVVDASRPGPRVNTRQLIGQRVAIGPRSGYKGLKGVVRDASDTAARVELEARNKIVTVEIAKLLFKAPHSDAYVPYREFVNPMARSSGGSNGSNGFSGAATPGRAGGRTPAFGGRTPAWNSGGKTPAWNAGGSKTPAWNSGGSKTPSWNAGGKTPAWNAGGKTPAWNAGGKTPAWNAGGKTPAWDAGGRTPAAGAGTSGFFSATTPASGEGFSAPTPGVYDSAMTPGIYAPTPAAAPTPGAAPTPAVWGDNDDDDDDDDAPQYEPASP